MTTTAAVETLQTVSPVWGEDYGRGRVAYVTPLGVAVWMFRKGQRVRLYDTAGRGASSSRTHSTGTGHPMTATLRRLGIIIGFATPVYLLLTTGLTMIVNPPRGGSDVSAAQQAAYARQDLVMAERAFDANVVQFNAWHHCAAVKDWKRQHPNAYPAKMVEHLDGSSVLKIVPWAYPAARGQWVVGFCS